MNQFVRIFLFLFALLPSICAADDSEYPLSGHLLVAAAKMPDYRFMGTVIYIYEHSEMGALGLVINRPMASVPAAAIAEQFEIDAEAKDIDVQIFWGGPVEMSRGFVLHSSDYVNDASKVIADGVVLTADNEILGAIVEGMGPVDSVFVLGYAGWGPGQLERELSRGDWLT
ncbi:MAG TPA: YqgE/AlgH family protein, partial [Alphaproteobacteria bacterium]|nr:YqgE/AlgH family protein [Alphaproteobacteria bacterium]